MDRNLDYINVLKALGEIPFPLGRKLLTDFLKGTASNESVIRNRLFKYPSFGSLAYEDHEIDSMIDSLISKGMISITTKNDKKWKLLEITDKGRTEIASPSLKEVGFSFSKTEITKEDREVFSALGDVLDRFNDEQKKAIISGSKHILCVAGAGSGKTTVLTSRIEFLIKYRSVSPGKILAITFTRKARQEMIKRLRNVQNVEVETFNSFCEKILKKYNDHAYTKKVRVMTYRDKIQALNAALASLSITIEKAIGLYFNSYQKKDKTQEELFTIFMNDCFFIRDFFKSKNKVADKAHIDIDEDKMELAELVFSIAHSIEGYMHENGLRDFSDQIIDTLHLFEIHPESIPKYDHILIDEYQDINASQIRLLDILDAENVFSVGDPRQSIYGWRGSDIRYILNFKDKYQDAEIVMLTRNYRSTEHIVNLINSSIKRMNLADLESINKGVKDVRLLNFKSDDAEYEFVIQRILSSDLPRHEIFVLARTNRQLQELSFIMNQRNIQHVVRTDELKTFVSVPDGYVTLATVHAIKGLEAEMVFLLGCTNQNFPCKASEHPIIDMIRDEEYDKEEEERRLFYVAMSRSKRSLYMTYSGKLTPFFTQDMLDMLGERQAKIEPVKLKENDDLASRLRKWRTELSKVYNIPPYLILNDRTIIDISQKMPLTKEDLEEVYGLGPSKIMKYGEEILNIVNGNS